MNSTSDGKLTKMLLKTKSGEFDIDSIHFLALRDMGLTELGCIGECGSLERLDLTGNRLTKLYALAGLANLSVLNLSNNNISSLEGLQAVENLQSLNVAGNNLDSLESLRWLTGSDKLTELRLRDNIRNLTNPLCGSLTYKADVTAMFPNLSTLDGERLRGKGSEFFKMCDEIEAALKSNSDRGSENCAISDPTEWPPEGFWSHNTEKFDQSRLGDAEEQLHCLLESCRHLTKQSSDKIQEAMSAILGTS